MLYLTDFLLFQNEREKEVATFMPLLRQFLLDVAKDSCSQKINFAASQMKELFKLGLMAIRQTTQISPETVGSVWQPQSWTSLQEDLVSSRFKNSPALHKMCEQIVRMLQKPDAIMKGPANGNQKRGIDEISGEALTEEPKKNKRKKKMKGSS
jgi:DNA polymerase phi